MGLLDYLSNIEFKPNAMGMGLLNMGANMMNASTNQRMPVGFGNIAGAGMSGMAEGMQNYLGYQQEMQKLAEEKALKDAQAQYYLAHARSFDAGGPDANLLNSVKTQVMPDGTLEYIKFSKNGKMESTGIKAPSSLENGMVQVKNGDGSWSVQNAPGVESAKYGQNAAGKAGQESETIEKVDRIDPVTGQVVTGALVKKGDIVGNNFGNIRVPGQNSFQSFNSPEAGINAIDSQLKRYGENGIKTLSDVISTWSPPNENNTPALIANASKMLGINPNQEIDLSNPVVRHMVSSAIMRQEHSGSLFNSQPMNGVPAGAITAADETAKTAGANERNQNESIVKARDNLLPARDNTMAILNTTDKLLSHPALKSVVGTPDWYQQNAFLNGSPQSDFKNIFSQLKGQGFIAAFQSLKGAGAITDREGEAATNAISRMSTSTSEKEFLNAVNDFKSIVKTGLNRAYDLANGKQFQKDTYQKPDWLNGEAGSSNQNPLSVRRWNQEKGVLE